MIKITYSKKELKLQLKNEDFVKVFNPNKKFGLKKQNGDTCEWYLNFPPKSDTYKTIVSAFEGFSKIETLEAVKEDMEIEALCIDTKCINSLKNHGILTIGELMDSPPEEIWSCNRMSRSQMRGIEFWLKEAGFDYHAKWYNRDNQVKSGGR